MPVAIPDTTTMFCSAKAWANCCAIRMAGGVAWRLPTMAMAGWCSNSLRPRTNNTGGGVMPSVSMVGKSVSQDSSKRQWSCCAHVKAACAACSASLRRSRHAANAVLRVKIGAISSAEACHARWAVPNCCSKCLKLSAPICGMNAKHNHASRSAAVMMFPLI